MKKSINALSHISYEYIDELKEVGAETLIKRRSYRAVFIAATLAVLTLCVSLFVVISSENTPPYIAELSVVDSSSDESFFGLASVSPEISNDLSENGSASPEESNTSNENSVVSHESFVQSESSVPDDTFSVDDTSKPDIENSDNDITSEPDSSTDVSTPPIEVLTIYTTAGGAGEFAADMYRPEGYHDNIGSVLALMMHYTPEDDAEFNVLIYFFKDMKIEDIISKVNETISEEIPLDQLKQVEVENDITESIKKYHLSLNKEQINALAENKVNCLYIGSGIGDYKDMNWDTVEGIKTYCEIRGDMYTFNGRGIDSDSDIYPEENDNTEHTSFDTSFEEDEMNVSNSR